MPAGWVAAGTALVGAAAGYAGQRKVAKAADKAGKREGEASAEALARSEQAFEQSEAALTPYARQEQAASTQMMAQMGLAPPGGGGGGGGGAQMGGGDSWGFGAAPAGGGGGSATGREGGEFGRFMEQMLGDQIAIAMRAGYSQDKAVAEGARRAEGMLQSLKKSGDLPADFTTPSLNDLVSSGHDMGANNAYAFKGSYGKNPTTGKNIKGTGPETLEVIKGQLKGFGGAETLLPQYFGGGGGQQNVVGVNPDGSPKMGIPTPGGTAQPGGPGGPVDDQRFRGGPQVQTAGSIMERAGMEGISPELRDQYQTDLMADPRSDPELAGYLGLTDESMQVGNEYQQTGAYQAARDQGMEAVNAGAATTGSLYSGRRGEALRDVGQDVEQQYYMDAMNRRESMMGARRGEYGRGISRRGAEYGAGRGREESAYNNYMQMLSGMSDPRTTSNIETMRGAAAQGEGANLMGTARNIGDLKMGSAANQAGMYGDIGAGVMQMGEAWIGR